MSESWERSLERIKRGEAAAWRSRNPSIEESWQAFSEVFVQWSESASAQIRLIYDELERLGYFEDQLQDDYEDDLNDPYWAHEEWWVFV